MGNDWAQAHRWATALADGRLIFAGTEDLTIDPAPTQSQSRTWIGIGSGGALTRQAPGRVTPAERRPRKGSGERDVGMRGCQAL